MQRTKLFLTLVANLLVVASTASAQSGNTGFGGSGMGGNSFGGGGFSGGGTSGFNSGMSSGLGGFSSGGMGGFSGGSGMGGMGGGMGGFGTSSLGGTGMGQNSFGNNQQGGQAFVGRDSADMASVFNQLGRNSNQFFQQLNRTMGRGNRGRQSSPGENAVLPVRVRLDVAFDRSPVQPTAVAAAVRGRLERLLTRRNINAPEVEIVGDAVVLRGVAASESQRLVIEKLVSLEPGVIAVDNQMTVAEEPSLSPPVPPQADN
jgi:hypothetical protein